MRLEGATPTNARDERITATTMELLRARGPRAVTVEAVAAESGVAKTTIYRRYRDRSDMLAAALVSVAKPELPPTNATAEAVLEWVVGQSQHAIEGGIGAGGAAALLAEDDLESTELIRSLLMQHRRALAEALDRILSDELRQQLDVDTVLDCIVGAYLAERARSGEVRPGWQERVLRTIRPALSSSSTA
ncbi:helix-turn-helix domain-containing protein [Nocardia sp. NPDC058518]|uniref:TetR/AcrR family transcriptional regulator n=1 Tax=Nocardia sp. NPDC058518 TaxID=3346534 RepID=UPI003663BF70